MDCLGSQFHGHSHHVLVWLHERLWITWTWHIIIKHLVHNWQIVLQPKFPTYPNPLSDAQTSAGLAAPAAAAVLMGKGGAVAILLVVLCVYSIFYSSLDADWLSIHQYGSDFSGKCRAHWRFQLIVCFYFILLSWPVPVVDFTYAVAHTSMYNSILVLSRIHWRTLISLYRTYFRPKASGAEIVRVSHYFICFWAVWMGAWATIVSKQYALVQSVQV